MDHLARELVTPLPSSGTGRYTETPMKFFAPQRSCGGILKSLQRAGMATCGQSRERHTKQSASNQMTRDRFENSSRPERYLNRGRLQIEIPRNTHWFSTLGYLHFISYDFREPCLAMLHGPYLHCQLHASPHYRISSIIVMNTVQADRPRPALSSTSNMLV